MNSTETEIKTLFELASEKGKKNVPKVLKNKSGEYTQKALKYNRQLIKEGKTFKYLDPTKQIKRTVKPNGNVQVTIQNIKYDKRYKNEKVPLKKFKETPKIGDVISTQALESKADKNYINELKNKLEKNKKKGKVQVDLSKISLKRFLKLLPKYRLENQIILGRPQGSNEVISLSTFNTARLLNYEALKGNEYSQREGSDNQFIFELETQPLLNVQFKPAKKKQKPNGSFFNYYTIFKDLDLTRYDIFNSKPDNYVNNCLYNALKAGGLNIEKLNELRLFVRSGSVPTCKLNEICSRIKIKITLRKLKKDNTICTLHFGTVGKNFDIGLLNNHYFIYEDTQITSWSIKNYEKIKDSSEWWKKCSKGNKGVTSFKVIKLLLENKEQLLIDIPIEDIMSTQYYNDMVNNDDLTYDTEKCLDYNKVSKTERSDYKKVYFDFETNTTGERHVPYLMCALTDDEQSISFTGKECGKDFIKWLKFLYSKGKSNEEGCIEKVLLIAHNLRYDYTFIFQYIFCLKPVLKGNSIMGGTGRIYINKGKYIEVSFFDSCNLITTKLSNFGEMFNLEQDKEILPYSLYTTENIENEYVDIDECLNHINNEEEKKQFLKNCEEWNVIDDGEVDIIEYSKKYCEIDCIVLKEGLNKFQEWISEITGLNVFNYCSIASLGLDYLIVKGCFDDCYKMCGRPREFIQRCVVGGRCMTRGNKKIKVTNKKVSDYDGVSLYPSSMSRIKGFLQGKPQIIKNKSFEWLNNNSDGYFVKVLCKNNPVINRGFPLLSSIDEKTGVREFTNETQGKFFYMDKTSIEDAVNFQGLEFDIICGYYYNEGHNNKINGIIKHLFNARLEAKKNKNPIQSIYKLLMNSCYGKCMLKPIDSEIEIVQASKFDEYLEYNYNFIKDAVDCGEIYIVKKIKSINDHFNNVYAGVEILSMSKRIMNEVICLGEDLGMNIYYTDTDSIHIDEPSVPILEKEFKKKYNRELNGKNLGQFHIDFELEKAEKDIHACESIFLGKKCYIDLLKGKDKEGNEVVGHHIRMKGVSFEAIKDYCEKYKTDYLSLYNELYTNKTLPTDIINGEKIERKFDLLASGKCCKFQYNSDMSVSSVNDFKRGVTFDYPEDLTV